MKEGEGRVLVISLPGLGDDAIRDIKDCGGGIFTLRKCFWAAVFCVL